MWVCPECKVRNIATSDSCSVCGTSPDGTKKATKSRSSQQVGVTRRFSVGTFMIMTTLFGVLFAVMNMLNIHPIVFACIGVFFMGIGLAQMFLFDGKNPRKASWVAGFPLGFICTLGGNFAASWTPGLHASLDEIIGSSIVFGVLGGPCGYIAGCLIAGIFLVRERESDKDADDNDTQDTDDTNQ